LHYLLGEIIMSNKQSVVPVFYAVDDNYAPVLHVGIQAIVCQADKNR
jgi:hypothetical protein